MRGWGKPITVEKKSRLKQLIQERCIKGLDPSVTLSSGERTYYYYDIKGLFDGEGLNLVGELLLAEVSKFNPKSIGGLEERYSIDFSHCSFGLY